MEHQVQSQIAAAVQAQLNQFTISQDSNRTAMSTYMQSQDARFAVLSNMIMQFMTSQQQYQQPTGIKCPASTIDLSDMQSTGVSPEIPVMSEMKQREFRKRQDLCVTPQMLKFDDCPGSHAYPLEVGSIAAHTSPGSLTTASPTKDHQRLNERTWESPNSNLAMHQVYASPGDPPSEDILPDAFASPTHSQCFLEDSVMSDTQVEDIQQQHTEYRRSQHVPSSGRKENTLKEQSKFSQNPKEDSAYHQAKPEDDAFLARHHDE